MGYQAGKGNKKAGQSAIGGQSNTFIGSDSGIASRGDENVFIGAQTGLQSVPNSETTATSNVFIGAYAGSYNTDGDSNVFIGRDAGQKNTIANDNIFIGRDAGKGNTEGTKNVFIGKGIGYGTWTNGLLTTPVTGDENVAIGYQAGNKLTTGGDNVFIGKEAGKDNTSGDDNIFIGKAAGEDTKGGIDKAGSRQLNIGNLIFGRIPISPPNPPTATPPGPDFFPDAGTGTNKYLKDGDDQEDGLVINGNLYVKGKAFANCGTNGACQETSISLGGSSSKVYKKNITPFLDFNKALTDITTTPLFTYEYKEDHPNHQRMGIIAEDLPPHLQIKDPYEPVKPDWVSIYGTLWASIKALFNKVTNLTKSILRLNSITSSLKVNLYEVKEKVEDLHGVKDRLEVLEKETQFLRNQNKELKKKIKALSKKGVSQ